MKRFVLSSSFFFIPFLFFIISFFSQLKLRIRLSGLQGLYVYILTSDDVDGFVSDYIDINRDVTPKKLLQNVVDRDSSSKRLLPRVIQCLLIYGFDASTQEKKNGQFKKERKKERR
jgi:hypothetical protein